MSSGGHICVGEAGEAKEALDVVMRSLPDVVFVDLVMPRKNGVAIAREIRDLWPEAKLIACTTMAPEEVPDPGARSAFDAWITKPFTKEQVNRILDDVTAARKEAHG